MNESHACTLIRMTAGEGAFQQPLTIYQPAIRSRIWLEIARQLASTHSSREISSTILWGPVSGIHYATLRPETLQLWST